MATSSNTALESGIIRTVHDRSNQFAQINRALLQNSALSWEARGVLSYLLSKPEDWEVRFTDLVKQGPGQADRMRRILKELESAGHMIRKRDHGAGGRWVWVTLVFENPADAAFSPYADFPYMDKPHAEKPDTENRHIYIDSNPTNKESTKKERRERTPAPVDIPTVAVVPEAPRDMQSTGRAIVPGVTAPKAQKQQPLPRPYALTEEMRAWAAMETPDLAERIDGEHKKFCNHYWSKAERRADWRPAWETWMMRAVDDFAPKQKGTPNGSHYQSADDRKAERWRQWAAVIAAEQAGDGPETEPRQNLRLIG